MGDTLDGEVEQVPCAAMLTRPGPDQECVYTRLPGDGLVATRHPTRSRENTATPGGQRKKKPGPESNVAPEVLLLSGSSLYEMRKERRFWAESE